MNRTKQLFNRWALEGHDKAAESEHSYAVFKVLSSLEWADTDSYLDIGCGNGYTLRYVSKFVKKGRLLGLDFSREMIKNARRASGKVRNAHFILADFTKWSAGGEKFDKVFSMEAFYYFKNVGRAVQKVHRLLNSGGAFACVVDFYAENKASHAWPKPSCCGVPMKLFTKTGWRRLFRRSGFKNIEQYQLKYPKKLAKAPWQTKVGSLVTVGIKR